MTIKFDERYAISVWHRWKADQTSVPVEWANTFQLMEQLYGTCFFPDMSEPAVNGLSADGITYLRRHGHVHADLDPLQRRKVPPLPAAAAAHPLSFLYTGTLAVETGHIDDPGTVDWIVQEFEGLQARPEGPRWDLLERVIETEAFDQFLAKKFPTKKRFGSEGSDAILPMLHVLAGTCEALGIEEIVMGSMHRGRLSILKNFAGMPADWLLQLIAGRHPLPCKPDVPADVPYHFGHEGRIGTLRFTLLPNPSHLEAVNPVVVGFARARRSEASARTVPVILHTDASVIGQGVNAELLQLGALPGFEVGGTIHIVINNQIGFTTNPSEARSSHYCTSAWRAIDSLILHVNGDDLDACARAVTMAARFQERFHRDAIIDLVCFRANGHNEIDEPRFTQPAYYSAADTKERLSVSYERRLNAAGKGVPGRADAFRSRVSEELAESFAAGALTRSPYSEKLPVEREHVRRDEKELHEIAERVSALDADTTLPKLKGLMDKRVASISHGVDWALAETIAMGSLLQAGVSVRLSGQDVERGSFSQRHLAAVNPESDSKVHPLSALAKHGARFEIVNSPLSEYAVLGFEYGYSLAAQNALCIWEAQFGDFLNGAQIVLDQFITSGNEKWGETSNLVMLLPHGLEGQGPEHSSARIERLLQLCARDNITLAHPSTPANYFHLLQGQGVSGQIPLIIVTPKKLLRLPAARSSLADMAGDTSFQPVISKAIGKGGRRAVLCSGKIAYELTDFADKRAHDLTIIRLERLYPLPKDEIVEALSQSGVDEFLWLQEEPSNYGAGTWLGPHLSEIADISGLRLRTSVGRRESSSPAGSFHANHESDQTALFETALVLEEELQAKDTING